MSTNKELTPAEQRYFEHEREAQKQGLTAAQYYRARGLSLYALYNVRGRLIRRGLVASRRGARAEGEQKSAFIAVRVAAPKPSAAGVLCRLQHPSGWVIECASWPPGSWLAECLGGGHVAA